MASNRHDVCSRRRDWNARRPHDGNCCDLFVSGREQRRALKSGVKSASQLPLAPELMSQALMFADGLTLRECLCVCKAMEVLPTVKHWETAANPVRWLQSPTPDPKAFESQAQARSYWKRWSRVGAGGVMGTNKVEAFPDAPWREDRTRFSSLPLLDVPRCAAAAAVDRLGRVFALGGWNDVGASVACESLTLSGESMWASTADASSIDPPPTLHPSGRPPSLAVTTGAEALASPVSSRGATNRAQESATGGSEGARAKWEALPPLRRPRCYLGASFEPRGALLAFGGGTGPYRDATAFETVEVLREGSDEWVEGPRMSHRRCGLGAVALRDGKVYVAGGYGGHMTYLNTAEVLDPCSEKWTDLPPMRARRTGVSLAGGPNGQLYAVGGSADGVRGYSSVERYDPREGKWCNCTPMIFGRAFCSAAFGASGLLYVVGGMSLHTGIVSTTEVFDPRSETWKARSCDRQWGQRAVRDSSLVFRPCCWK